MKKPKFLTNWKTTAIGVLTFVGAAGPQFMTVLDEDPATNPEWKIIMAAAGVMLGLSFARDGDKSSAGKKV